MKAFLKKHEHSITTFFIVYSFSILLLYIFLAGCFTSQLTFEMLFVGPLTTTEIHLLIGPLELLIYAVCLYIGLAQKSHGLLRVLSVLSLIVSPVGSSCIRFSDFFIQYLGFLQMMHSQILIANLPVSLIFILFLNGQRLLKLPGMLFYSLSVCFGGACGLLFFTVL